MRVFLGSTINRLGVLSAVILFSAMGLRRVLGIRMKDLLFQTHLPWWQDLVFGCLLTLVLMMVIFGIEVSRGWLMVESWGWRSMRHDIFAQSVWLSLLSNLDAGVGEEVLFRGYLLTGLCRVANKWNGLALMGLIFAVFHLPVTGADQTNWLVFSLLLTLPGVLLGFAYLNSRALWLPIAIHFTWDLSYDLLDLSGGTHPGLFGALTQLRGPTWFMGTSFGIEVGLAGVLLAIFLWIGV